MGTQVAYCSACDRNVPVVLRPGALEHVDPAHAAASEAIICLDYGVNCTGSLCPLFLVPDEVEAGLPGSDPVRRGRT